MNPQMDSLSTFVTQEEAKQLKKERKRRARTVSREELVNNAEPAGWSPSFYRSSTVAALLDGGAKTKHERELGNLLACMWEHGSDGADILGGRKADGRTFVCKETQMDDRFAAAVGPRILPYGTTEFSFTIMRSEDGNGTSMLLGLAADTGGHASQGKWGQVWGLGPWNGRLFGFPDACNRAADRAGEMRGEAVMRGDLRGRANGTEVRLRVDMQREDCRRLYFQVGTATEWSLARDAQGLPIQLPRIVRPFARAARAGDTIAISRATHLGEGPNGPAATSIAHSRPPVASTVGAPPPPPPQPAASLPGRREKELEALVDQLQGEVSELRLSLARERQLRAAVEREARMALQQYNMPNNQRRNSLIADRRVSIGLVDPKGLASARETNARAT